MTSNDTVTLHLERSYVGHIMDGLEVLIEQWDATREYLESGLVNLEVMMRDCDDPDEAQAVASYYRGIRTSITRQLESHQASQQPHDP